MAAKDDRSWFACSCLFFMTLSAGKRTCNCTAFYERSLMTRLGMMLHDKNFSQQEDDHGQDTVLYKD
ncbi:MAG: hypothetical protein RBQ88_00960 [Desulfobulbus oligotrophicus]|nr:hypothetical protein [Desulfobulbus oligotrophicus]